MTFLTLKGGLMDRLGVSHSVRVLEGFLTDRGI